MPKRKQELASTDDSMGRAASPPPPAAAAAAGAGSPPAAAPGDEHLAAAMAAAAPPPHIAPVPESLWRRAFTATSEALSGAFSRARTYGGIAATMASEAYRRHMEPKTLLQEIQSGLQFSQLAYRSPTVDSILAGTVAGGRTKDELLQALKVRNASVALLRATYEMLARYNRLPQIHAMEARAAKNVMAPGGRILPSIQYAFLKAYYVFTYLLVHKFTEDKKLDVMLAVREMVVGRALVREASLIEKPTMLGTAEILRFSPRELIGINAMVNELLRDNALDKFLRDEALPSLAEFAAVLDVPEGGFPRIRDGQIEAAKLLYSAIQDRIQTAAVVMEERPVAVRGLLERMAAAPAAPPPVAIPTIEPSTTGVGAKRGREGTAVAAEALVAKRREIETSGSNSESNSNSNSALEPVAVAAAGAGQLSLNRFFKPAGGARRTAARRSGRGRGRRSSHRRHRH